MLDAIETWRVILAFDLDFGESLARGVLTKPSVIIFHPTDERADTPALFRPQYVDGSGLKAC